MAELKRGEESLIRESDKASYEAAYKAMKNGDLTGMYRVGFMQHHGQGTPIQKEAGWALMEKAANLGNHSAQSMLFNIFYPNDFDHLKQQQEKIEQSFRWGTPLVQEGYSFAQLHLGVLHYHLFMHWNRLIQLKLEKGEIDENKTPLPDLFEMQAKGFQLIWLAARQDIDARAHHSAGKLLPFMLTALPLGTTERPQELSDPQLEEAPSLYRYLYKLAMGRIHLLNGWGNLDDFSKAEKWLKSAAQEERDIYGWAKDDLRCLPRYRELAAQRSNRKKESAPQ
uniref:Sel1 repeat family protein n=1 Tax=Magnetococcus massalia (strain MO-1) TaxID=451514 RepID=A0A1S7LGJ7_MAGMO|nr:protein of unknown function[Include sel1 domain] [Candidatus Magnetococcus massalia]